MQIPALTSIDPSLLSVSPLEHGRTFAAPTPEQVNRTAEQFEAVLLRQLLAPAIEPMMSGGAMGGENSGSGVYGYMLTDTLATAMAQGGGLGLAAMFKQQMAPAASPSPVL